MAKRMIDAIVEVFKNNANAWLDYNEIYEQMDKTLFGPNKRGERGKRNIVYRLLLGYSDLFEIDDNYRPKKFRLALEQGDPKNLGVKAKYSIGESVIYLNDKRYEEIAFSSEEDFEEEVRNNYRLIFGEKSTYYDVKKKIGNKICDAIVYDEELGKVLIIENELFIHDLWGHIIPQIIEFFNGMNDEQTKINLKYNVDWHELHKLSVIKAIDKSSYEIVVVIDRITFDIKKAKKDINELIKHFVRNKEIKIHFKEFKVFVSNDGEKVYLVS